MSDLTDTEIQRHRNVQTTAKDVLAALADMIGPDDTERSLTDKAVQLLEQRGIHETWYHECPALVLLGSRSCLSVSGRQYVPNDERVGMHNLVTVDLSPLKDGICGDCARSFFVENGTVTTTPRDPAFQAALRFVESLHMDMLQVAQPAMSFDKLFLFAKRRIGEAGFENLDFLGNVGHTIGRRGQERVFIENQCQLTLAEAGMFTFEPHVRAVGGRWGFKHENIYFANSAGILEEL